MDKNLEQQIASRKDEVKRKKVEHKAQVIARGLGEDISRPTNITDFCYEDQNLYIRSYCCPPGDVRTRTEIILPLPLDKTVYFQENGRIEKYIPGTWEEVFDSLYEKAIPALRERESRIKAEQKAQKASRNAEDERYARECFGL